MVSIENEEQKWKVPILGDIPLIGRLFRNSETTRKKTNLVVFITPQIIHSAEEHKHILSDKLTERMRFMREFTTYNDPYVEFTTQEMQPKTDSQKQNTEGSTDQTSPTNTKQEQPSDEPMEDDDNMEILDEEPLDDDVEILEEEALSPSTVNEEIIPENPDSSETDSSFTNEESNDMDNSTESDLIEETDNPEDSIERTEEPPGEEEINLFPSVGPIIP